MNELSSLGLILLLALWRRRVCPWIDHGVLERVCGDELDPRWRRMTVRQSLSQTLGSTSIPHNLLWEDKSAMRWSIESRVPFLVPDLARHLASLPASYLISARGVTKHVFREALRGLVPDVVLDRPDKIGFQTPELEWLRSRPDWVEENLGGEVARSIGVVRPERLVAKWQRILAGKERYDPVIWRWLNLVKWAEITGARFPAG